MTYEIQRMYYENTNETRVKLYQELVRQGLEDKAIINGEPYRVN